MTEIHLLATLTLATVFAFSGALKLRDQPGTRAAVRSFGVSRPTWAHLVAVLVTVLELALAVGLVTTVRHTFFVVALIAVLVLLGFTVVVARALASGTAPPCHCFGELSQAPMSGVTLLRNVALLGLGVFVAASASRFDGFLPVLRERSGWAVAWVLTTWLVGLAALVLWSCWRSAERRAGDDAAPTETPGSSPVSGEAGAGSGVAIPGVAVLSREGIAVDLRSLPGTKSVLVVGIAPGCESCSTLAPLLPSLREQIGKEVSTAVLSWSSWAQAAAAYPDLTDNMYADPHGQGFQALAMVGTPSAVLLGTDGQIVAGPVLGGEGVLELVSAITQAIGVNIVTGVAHQLREPRPIGGEDTGSAHLPAPGTVLKAFVVETEDGRRMTFGEAVAGLGLTNSAVVAWRSTCTFCAEVATEMAQFSERAEVLLLVSEDVAEIRAQGLTGPVLRTVEPNLDAARALGLPGTPAGYPIASHADEVMVGAGGGVGGGSVLRMLSEQARAAGSYVSTPLLTQMEALHAHARGEHDHPVASHR